MTLTRTVTGRTDHVAIMGAGLSGLSAALHLLGAGRRVSVLERGAHPGGRAGRLELSTGRGNYLLDTGPTVLTMPELLEEALAAVGERLADRLELLALSPAYRAHFADGSTIDVHTDAEAMHEEVSRTCGQAAAVGYLRTREWLTRLYRLQIDRFIGANMDSPLRLLGPQLARLVAAGGFGRLGPRVARMLPDERLQRIFSFQTLYAGLAPQRAPALYGVIGYMDTVGGVFFPRGGMRAVGSALADAVVAAGGEIHYGRTVTGLERRGGRVTALRHHGDGGRDPARLACDAAVLSGELAQVYRLLGRAPRRPVPLRYAPSAVVLHAGLATSRPQAAHHTISFGARWRESFREIIDDGLPMSDPSLLITRPTASDPTLAPQGGELLFVLAPCPNLLTGPIDWPRLGPAYRDELLAVLAARAHPGLTGLDTDIEVSRLVTPSDWAQQGMTAGTPFSLAHTIAQTGPFRPRNLVRGLENVVLAGCGTTPGVGIPPVLISGRLAAQRITGTGRTGRVARGR